MRALAVRYAAACAFAWCMSQSGSALADAAPPADAALLHVPYTAPPECPNADAFAAELAKRTATPRSSTIEGAHDPRRFSVRIEKEAAGFAGELTVTTEGSRGTRHVRGPDCAAVVRSLAVFVALALAEHTEDTTTVSPSTRSPEPPPPTPAPSAPPAAQARRKPPRPRRPTPAPPSFWRFDSGIQAQYTRAGADAWGARVSAEWSRVLATSPIVPALRLSWGFADFTDPLDAASEIHFRLRTARAEACGGMDWRRIRGSLCAAFELGQLAVASSGLPRNGRAESGWYAVGLIARTRVTIVDPLGVELALGLFDPLQRAEFTLTEPVRQVYRVPSFALEGQLGVALSARWK